MELPKLVMRKGAQSDDWGTPREVVDMVRSTLGDIDIDLASSEKHNKVVGAYKYYSIDDPCPEVTWTVPTTFCNPPGPVANVRWFWDVWCNTLAPGRGGAFLIFQIDHWRTLPAPPRDLWCLLWPKRLKFVGAKDGANFSSVLVLTKKPQIDANVVLWRAA